MSVAATPDQVVELAMREAQRRGIEWFSPIHAGGMTGSFMQETGDFRSDVIDFRRRGDNGTAHGLMQWRGDRFKNLTRFARENGLEAKSLMTQLMFAFEEGDPNSKYADYGSVRAFREMSQATNSTDAAIAFIHAERPAGYDGNPRNAHDAKARANHANRALSGSGNPDISQFADGGVKSSKSASSGAPMSQKMAGSFGSRQQVQKKDLDFGVSSRSNLDANTNRRARGPSSTPNFGITSFGDNSDLSFGGLDFSDFGNIEKLQPPNSNQLTSDQSFGNVDNETSLNFGLNS